MKSKLNPLSEPISAESEKTVANNPLAEAIALGAKDHVIRLLAHGIKLSYQDLTLAFSAPIEDKGILNLLFKYQALPPTLSPSTLKLILYLDGKYDGNLHEILSAKDLNLQGCVGLPSPMTLAAQNGDVSLVKWLIAKNVEERPLLSLFNTAPSYFSGLNLLNIEEFKERIEEKLKESEEFYEIAELFMHHTTKKLYEDIIAEPRYLQNYLAPFFAWAAVNNRYDLLRNQCFIACFSINSDLIKSAVKIAAVFGAHEFVLFAMPYLDQKTLNIVLSIAARDANLDLLTALIKRLEEIGTSIALLCKAKNKNPIYQIPNDDCLYWAIRSRDVKIVNILLENSFDVNSYHHYFSGRNYLHIAVIVGDIEIVQSLVHHGIHINHPDKTQNTPLHTAILEKNWPIAQYLIHECKASKEARNKEGLTPLDYCKDEKIKKKILQATYQEKKSDDKTSSWRDKFGLQFSSSKTNVDTLQDYRREALTQCRL